MINMIKEDTLQMTYHHFDRRNLILFPTSNETVMFCNYDYSIFHLLSPLATKYSKFKFYYHNGGLVQRTVKGHFYHTSSI